MNVDNLPSDFISTIKNVYSLKEFNCDVNEYFNALDMNFYRSLRLNSLKVSSYDEFIKILNKIHSDFGTAQEYEKVPWSDDGYYISDEFFPAKHPLFSAGLFYLQEPSAMLPANVLNAKPRDIILDLCAAPGGKSLKIAADMKGEGLLYANDISSNRIKPLIRNIELMGCTNCIVLNESPQKLSEKFIEYFDKIIIDAPCSGEGMFRKDTNAIKSWEKYGPSVCMNMQTDILEYVHIMLKPGGVIVYSTCTFNLEENEKMIESFINKYNKNYEVAYIENSNSLISNHGLSRGLIANHNINNALRIFPSDSKGEGHFCIKLKKIRTDNLNIDQNINCSDLSKINNKNIKTKTDDFTNKDFEIAFRNFGFDLLKKDFVEKIFDTNKSHIFIFKGHVYILPQNPANLDGLRVIKHGFYLGNLKRTRKSILFIPSHSFALATKMKDYIRYINFDSKDIYLQKYLKGETININDLNKNNIFGDTISGGYYPVLVLGYVLGWCKVSKDSNIKNLYPAGWVKTNELQ